MKSLSIYSSLTICMVIVLWILYIMPARATWISPDDTVPIERLLKNLQQQLESTPDSPALLGQIARVHSRAYATDQSEFRVMDHNKHTQNEGKPDADAPNKYRLYEQQLGKLGSPPDIVKNISYTQVHHLQESIRYYLKATAYEDATKYHWLGLGYSLHEAARIAERLVWPYDEAFDEEAIATLRRAYEDRAVEAYQKAYHFEGAKSGSLNPPVAYEAGSAIVKILSKRAGRSKEEERELKVIRRKTIELGHYSRAITPIIFHLEKEQPLHALLAPETQVDFDLDGHANGMNWPWVQPDTAFLVWDSNGDGTILSGRQLIGSVTWWMFWDNGYAVLQALDDNRNGWLEGVELNGLAVWQDQNSNGVSDPGEVQPLAVTGVSALSVKATTQIDGMPANLEGLRMKDGRMLPTYDWIVSPLGEAE